MNRKLNLMAGLVAMVASNAAAAFAQNIRVVVDGDRVRFHGQPPIEMDDRVLVPLRGVFESLGAQVNWNPDSQTVTARRGDAEVRLRIGDQTARVNGDPVRLDVPAQIIDDSTMVPLRFIGEALGDRVHWDEETQTVSIIDGGQGRWTQDNHDNGDYDIHRGWRHNEDTRGDQGNSDDSGSDQPRVVEDNIPDREPPIVYDVDTVIPATVDEEIDLSRCRLGQRVTTVVSDYPGLPPDCQVTGVVTSVDGTYGWPRRLGIHFDTLVTPGGRRYHIDGHTVPFDTDSVIRGRDGLYHRRGFNSSVDVVRAERGSQRFGIRLDRSVTIHRESGRSGDRGRNDRGDSGHRF